jgi:serine protease
MLAANPALTPAQTRSLLQASARPFVSVGAGGNQVGQCQAPGALDQIECYCTTTTCGAGMLDAGAAVARAAGLPVPPLAVFQLSNDQPTAGSRIQIDSAPSSVSVTGRSWSLVSGGTLARFDAGTSGVMAGLQTDAAGTVVVRLAASDANGNTVTSDRSFQVKSGPTAALQVAQLHPTVGGAIRLDAGASVAAPGRSIVTYGWALTGTTGGRFTSATNASVATLVADSVGQDLTVSVTVTDSAGEQHTTTHTLEVAAGPVAAVALASQSAVAGSTVSLDASGSSAAPGHAIAAYDWSIVTGSTLAQITAGADAANATLAVNAVGTVVVRLRITDDAGATSTADATVTVAPAPVVVTASGGGGGALGGGWLLALAAAVLVLRGLDRAPQASAGAGSAGRGRRR